MYKLQYRRRRKVRCDCCVDNELHTWDKVVSEPYEKISEVEKLRNSLYNCNADSSYPYEFEGFMLLEAKIEDWEPSEEFL